MSRFPKLRPTPWDGLVVLAAAALAALCLLYPWGGRGQGELTVVVSIDGREADRFPPEELLQSPRTYTGNGYALTLALAVDDEDPYSSALPPSGEMGVRVIAADCPTQDCVHTGVISRSGQSIVCLPARIIISLEGREADPGGPVDAVLG